MACDTCNEQSNSNLPYNFGNLVGTVNCDTTSCSTIYDALCIKYTSTDFNCISNESKSLEAILKSIDSLICEASGGIPWGEFDYACLEDITDAQSFVENISAYVCELSEEVTVNYDELLTLINNINTTGVGTYVPALSGCTYTGVINTDTLNQILVKFNTKFCDLNSRLDISGVNFSQCFAVSAPTTIAGAFTALLNQICSVKASIPTAVVLPTFNNVGSCLPSPTTTDTLVATINKIKTVLCSKPSFDVGSLSPFMCVAAGTDLQSTIENIRAKVTTLVNNSIDEVGPGLTLTDIAAPEACEGKRLEIDFESFPDELVKATGADATAGYLIDKLNAGDNVTIDDTTLPGTLTITAEDAHVKTSAGDATTGYLMSKLLVDSIPELSLILSEDTTTDPTNYKARITPNIDFYALTERILTTIATNSTLRTMFCNIDCTTLPTCNPPSNVSVIWEDPEFSVGYGVPGGITGVNIYYREKGDSTWLDAGVTPPNPQPALSSAGIPIVGLDPLTIYQFKVSSICPDTSESDSAIVERMSTTAMSPSVTPATTSIAFNFGTNVHINSITLIIKNVSNVVISTTTSVGPSFTFNVTGLTTGTNYNPSYYYNYTVNGISTQSSTYTMSTVTTL